MINHSRLADLDIEVREHLVLVGPNDVGKSSVLRCIDLLLGASTAQLYARLTSEDLRDVDQPLVIEAILTSFSPADEALFPDEITIEPDSGAASLTLRLLVSVDATQTLSIERSAPDGGTGRQLSRAQLLGIGWRSLSATAVSRELREDRRGVIDDIMQDIDLGDERADFDSISKTLEDRLQTSAILSDLRAQLAGQLTKALPENLDGNDLAFVPGSTANEDVLSDVRLRVTKDGVQRNLAEQSDGMRALYALALYDLISLGANMVGIDEPEIHLHPTSQRSLGRLLQSGPNQKVIATHSTDIVGAFDSDCIVAVRAGGILIQPRRGLLSTDERMSVRWWVRDKLEPLTARRVIAVEGISDRIILERVSNLTSRNLDRLGISVVETDGAGDMGAIIKLFGPKGFDILMSLLIDSDAATKTADKLMVPEADLNQHSVWISNPDLEAEYVVAIGSAALWEAMQASPMFTPNELANCVRGGPSAVPRAEDLAEFCRNPKRGYKVRAAMVAAPLLDETSALGVESINGLLDEIVPPE